MVAPKRRFARVKRITNFDMQLAAKQKLKNPSRSASMMVYTGSFVILQERM